MTDSFSWDDLRHFLAVVRAGSLTSAGRRLGVSQPTVGRRLIALEERLGARLFERRAKTMSLTEAGRELLPFAEEIERQAGELAMAADSLAQRPGRELRITAIGSVALFLVRHGRELQAACPGLPVEIFGTGERLSLGRREADIALRMNKVPRDGDLVCRKVGRLAYALYAQRGSKEMRLVGHKRNPKTVSQAGWIEAQAPAHGIALRLNDLHLRFEAARQGLGRSLLPCHLGDSEPMLVRADAPVATLEETIYMLVHRSRRRDPTIRTVMNALNGLVARYQDELLGLST